MRMLQCAGKDDINSIGLVIITPPVDIAEMIIFIGFRLQYHNQIVARTKLHALKSKRGPKHG